jgi:signal transduction histidine kinase
MVALMGIVLAFSVSWILSRRMTRPVKELVRATKEVATGNFAGTIGIDSKDEIGTLAASFTRMVDELRKSRTEVENYRLELEKKFTQRGKELAETEKKRAAMAHMIAHDLKNPILGIKKALEGLDRTTPDSAREQRSKILRDLLNAGDLVIGMVNEMLDLYQSDFGDIPLYLTSFQIKECVETSLRILGPELEERGLQVISRSDPPHISLMADKRRLTRLLINLISNAVNFSPDQSHIYVFASLLENDKSGPLSVLLRVEDEGAGIPQEDLLKIFDRFYSRDQGRAQAGTGLGLPYCKLVAESHGGRIWAETRRRGGLTVSLILPSSIAVRQESYGT